MGPNHERIATYIDKIINRLITRRPPLVPDGDPRKLVQARNLGDPTWFRPVSPHSAVCTCRDDDCAPRLYHVLGIQTKTEVTSRVPSSTRL